MKSRTLGGYPGNSCPHAGEKVLTSERKHTISLVAMHDRFIMDLEKLMFSYIKLGNKTQGCPSPRLCTDADWCCAVPHRNACHAAATPGPHGALRPEQPWIWGRSWGSLSTHTPLISTTGKLRYVMQLATQGFRWCASCGVVLRCCRESSEAIESLAFPHLQSAVWFVIRGITPCSRSLSLSLSRVTPAHPHTHTHTSHHIHGRM